MHARLIAAALGAVILLSAGGADAQDASVESIFNRMCLANSGDPAHTIDMAKSEGWSVYSGEGPAWMNARSQARIKMINGHPVIVAAGPASLPFSKTQSVPMVVCTVVGYTPDMAATRAWFRSHIGIDSAQSDDMGDYYVFKKAGSGYVNLAPEDTTQVLGDRGELYMADLDITPESVMLMLAVPERRP